jgi:hypothetical protein
MKPGLNRYLRVTPCGLLRIDSSKVKAEKNLDGKYLLRCSDPYLRATGRSSVARGQLRLGRSPQPRTRSSRAGVL